MSNLLFRPARSALIAVALVVGASSVVLATGCDRPSSNLSWRLGSTHGAIVEATAGRASLGVYRVPSRVLYQVLARAGIRAVQDTLWAFGRPPELSKTFTYRDRSITLRFGTATRALRAVTKQLIYDDPGDLEGGLRSAHRTDDCLALTLVSYGLPTSNWTSKRVGCRAGALR